MKARKIASSCVLAIVPSANGIFELVSLADVAQIADTREHQAGGIEIDRRRIAPELRFHRGKIGIQACEVELPLTWNWVRS